MQRGIEARSGCIERGGLDIFFDRSDELASGSDSGRSTITARDPRGRGEFWSSRGVCYCCGGVAAAGGGGCPVERRGRCEEREIAQCREGETWMHLLRRSVDFGLEELGNKERKTGNRRNCELAFCYTWRMRVVRKRYLLWPSVLVYIIISPPFSTPV